MSKRNNKKEKKMNRRTVVIERDCNIVKQMNKDNVVITANVKVAEKSSQKRNHKNILLEDITFKYNNINYKINHCWLQEKDYPAGMYESLRENTEIDVEFVFYPYTDASNRGMHGMTINAYKKHYDLGLLF